MTTPYTLELRRLAEAATPGPWCTHPLFPDYVVPENHADRKIGGHENDAIDLATYAQEVFRVVADRHRPRTETTATAAFIAAANPAAIIALLDRLEAAEGRAMKLVHYAVHDDDCTVNRYPEHEACSCGLRLILQETRHAG